MSKVTEKTLADETDILVRKIINEGVDAIIGGWPCQDISTAGKGAGLSGERSGLWRYLFRAIRLVRPRIVFLENVAELLNRGMGEVVGNLASIGYDAEWNCLQASAFGCPHERKRCWIVANPTGQRWPETLHNQLRKREEEARKWQTIALDTSSNLRARARGEVGGEPPIFRRDDEVTKGLDISKRLHAIGNGNPPCIIRELTRNIK